MHQILANIVPNFHRRKFVLKTFRYSVFIVAGRHANTHTQFLQFTGIEFIVLPMVVWWRVVLRCVTSTNVLLLAQLSLLRPPLLPACVPFQCIYYMWRHLAWRVKLNKERSACITKKNTYWNDLFADCESLFVCLLGFSFVLFFLLLRYPLPRAISILFGVFFSPCNSFSIPVKCIPFSRHSAYVHYWAHCTVFFLLSVASFNLIKNLCIFICIMCGAYGANGK